MSEWHKAVWIVAMAAAMPLWAQACGAGREQAATIAAAENGLPDAPGSTSDAGGGFRAEEAARAREAEIDPALRSAMAAGIHAAAQIPIQSPERRSGAGWTMVLLTGALFASSTANAEALYRCDNCTYLPASMHRRGVSYGAGFTIDIAATYAGHLLRRGGHRWWFAPQAALTGANAYLAYHWASSTD